MLSQRRYSSKQDGGEHNAPARQAPGMGVGFLI
jgi:hypothetical protein